MIDEGDVQRQQRFRIVFFLLGVLGVQTLDYPQNIHHVPNFYFSLFKASSKIIDEPERIRRKFLWGGGTENSKICWIGWEKVLTPKRNGGLGVISLRATNLSLLTKWLWKFKKELNSLVVKIITALQSKNNIWQTFPAKADRAGVWRNITKTVVDLDHDNINLMEFMKKEIGRGDKTAFWWEDWSGNGILKEMFLLLFKIEKEKCCTVHARIKQMGEMKNYEWRWRKENLSTEEEMERVCCELILHDAPLSETEDKWTWQLETHGDFSVKSLRRKWETENLQELQYKHWWNSWVPIKVNFLGWRAALNRLPVKAELRKRHVQLPDHLCGFCNTEEETCEHLFLQCPWAKEVWRGVEEWGGFELRNIGSIQQLLSITNHQTQPTRDKKMTNTLLLVTLWALWKSRNDRNFNGRVTPPWRTIEEIKSQSFLWIKNRGVTTIPSWVNWWKQVSSSKDYTFGFIRNRWLDTFAPVGIHHVCKEPRIVHHGGTFFQFIRQQMGSNPVSPQGSRGSGSY
ncbi:hypothetical protein LXL04_011078 [Taraxacum kok-saghyz]